MTTRDLLLPRGSVLLHVGPYKTSTTAVQAAMFAARPQFEEHGVYYPGRWRRAMRESWSILEWSPRGRPPPPPITFWEEYAADIASRTSMRSCVSSEDLASASPAKAAKMVADLGGPERVHVMMVLRRFDKLLPSAWQERVKGHDVRSYDQWLREILDDECTSQAHTAFWRTQSVRRVATSFLESLPPDHFHVVVMDDSQRDLMQRLFEQMLGLPDGMLVAPEGINASLSANSAELIRLINLLFDEREWNDELYHQLIYLGATQAMMDGERSDTDVRLPPLPSWAVPDVMRLTEDRISVMAELGVDVIGDPEALRLPESFTSSDRVDTMPETISLVQALAAVQGAIEGSQRLEQLHRRSRKKKPEATGPVGDDRRIADVSGRELLGAALRRLRDRGRS